MSFEHEPRVDPDDWFTSNPPPSAPPAAAPSNTGATPGFRALLNQAYQKYYKRDATEAEVQAHAGNPGGIDAVETLLKANVSTTKTTNTGTTPTQAMNGWDQTKWADPAHTSLKYTVGRILAKYPPSVQGMTQAFAEIKQLYPQATFDGKDSITFAPGSQPIDMLANASSGQNMRWWWSADAAQPGTPAAASSGAAPTTGAITAKAAGSSAPVANPGGSLGYMVQDPATGQWHSSLDTAAARTGTGTLAGIGQAGGGASTGTAGGAMQFNPNTGQWETVGNGPQYTYDGATGQWSDPTSGATARGTNVASNTAGDPYNAFGALLTPWIDNFQYDPFVAPTDVTEQNDPGYQFRLKQGEQAIQRSASAKGTLLTGGTLKDLTDYAQGRASDEYGGVYNRAFTDWSTNYNKALGEYRQRYDIFNNNQSNIFNRLSSLAGMGQVSATNLGGSPFAGQYSSALLNGAAAQGDYLTQIGNANAAGTVGGSNAINGALGNIGNDALTWAYLTRGSSYGK